MNGMSRWTVLCYELQTVDCTLPLSASEPLNSPGLPAGKLGAPVVGAGNLPHACAQKLLSYELQTVIECV